MRGSAARRQHRFPAVATLVAVAGLLFVASPAGAAPGKAARSTHDAGFVRLCGGEPCDPDEMSDAEILEAQNVPKDFVLVAVVDSYAAAQELVAAAARKTGIPINLRGLRLVRGELSERDCGDEPFPCVVELGRLEDSTGLSIEPASADYLDESDPRRPVKGVRESDKDFWLRAHRYYQTRFAVVAAHGEHGSQAVADALKVMRKSYRRAKIVTFKVYMGCMH